VGRYAPRRNRRLTVLADFCSKAAIDLIQADDAYLDELGADSADAVIFAFVLCTVSDTVRALRRARRVLKPAGTLAVLEHVRANGWLGRLQDRVAPLWYRAADGCYLNRNTLQAIETAGFDVAELEHRRIHGIIIGDLIAGHARKT
jgi:ubiquinone/menaquinone biosynthesis C-methylase UbiE